MKRQQPARDFIFENSWTWKALLKNNDGTILGTLNETFDSEATALTGSAKLAENTNELEKYSSGQAIF